MQLSRFFTLDELTHSNTAKAEGIDNQPTPKEAESLRALCTAVLDPLREAVGQPIKVTSGYRGPALNLRIKGAKKSQHLNGQAADLQAQGLSVLELFKTVIRLGLPFDQIIYEVKGASKWVHVSHNTAERRGQILLAKFAADGSVTYPAISAEQALAMADVVTRSRGPAAAPTYEETADEPDHEAPLAQAGEAVAARAPAKKAPARTTPTKSTPPRKTSAKQPARKAAPTQKAAAKNAPAKKVAAKQAPAKKVAAKPVAARNAPARTAAVKSTVAKKSLGKAKAGRRS